MNASDTALRLSWGLGLTDMFFINMQAHYDAEIVHEHLVTELATIASPEAQGNRLRRNASRPRQQSIGNSP